MLNRIINFSISNKLIIGLMVLALIGYGIFQAFKLPIDAVPDITDNQVQVITIAPSFGATDIERLITIPIEQANSNISGLKEIRSFSRFGLSLVTIVFDEETDVYWARQQVTERLQIVQTQIPKGIGTPELAPVTTGLGEIYQYVVKCKEGYEGKYDITELRTIQDNLIKKQLVGVQGVADVSSFGGKLKQYVVEVNLDKLNASGVTISQVFDALESNNENTGGAYIEKSNTVLYIRSEGLIGNLDDIKNISIIRENNEAPIFIRDIANVTIGSALRYGAMCFNDEGEVAGAIVMMLKGENSSNVIGNIKTRIEEIQKSLPEGVEIVPFLDRTKMVNNTITTLRNNLLEGALIVVFVLVIFLGNLRAGLIVASVIPLSMLFAIILMNAFGVSGNLMSLGALDFGLIVDGAVIIVEAVMHQLHYSRIHNQKEMDKLVNSSASKMMNSAVFGQIIILIVYLPIFTLQGIEGKMFKPMAQTVAFALLGAFLLSLTYVPMMSALFLSKKHEAKPNISDRVLSRISSFYQFQLVKVLRRPKLVLGSVVLMFIGALVTLTFLGGQFIPPLEEGDFAVDTRVLTGSNLSTTIEYTQKAAHILKTEYPEVEMVVTKIGSGEVPTDPMPMEASDMMVILKDKSEWTSATSFNELADKMSTSLKKVPGITAGFQYPVQMRFNELMTGARQDVVCKIFGENLDTLSKYASELGLIVSTIEGVENLYVEPITGMPQIIIEFDRNKIAQYNLSIAEVNKVLNTALAGQSAGLVFEGEKRFDLVVKLADSDKKNLEDVQNVLIPLVGGEQIPLAQLAIVQIKDGPNQIQREDAKRRIIVGFNVNGRDVQSIVQELQTKVDANFQLPSGYFVKYAGSFENLQQAKNRLYIAVPVSLLLIFILLFFAFNSFKHSLLIYSAIPLSAIGGIFFLALRGLPFSISAGVGFIALFGVAVLNGIVLIAEFNRLREITNYSLTKIVLVGTKLRFRPVLMTAFVASLGFLPMALSNGSGAEVQRPLATVVIGGLLIATLLTLFVLPLLYVIFENGVNLRFSFSKQKVLGLLFILFCGSAWAQQEISLENAWDLAQKNNRQIMGEALQVSYSKSKISSAFEIPKTNVGVELGQVNSAYFDTKFLVNQSLPFPLLFFTQKQILTEDWKIALANKELTENDVKLEVSRAFFYLLYLKEKEKIYVEANSLYESFLEKSNLRYQKGESNILEKVTAENQKAAINLQLSQIQIAKNKAQAEFQFLLNTDEDFIPASTLFSYPIIFSVNDLAVSNNPSLKMYDLQQEKSKTQTKLEKVKLLPDLTVGYANNSFVGNGPDNKYYNPSNRFHSLQLGVNVPLFFVAQKSNIQANKIQEDIYSLEKTYQEAMLNKQFTMLKNAFIENNNLISYYESVGFLNSKIIKETALLQLQNGEINYLDYVQIINQTISIKSEHLELIFNQNETVLFLKHLTATL